MGAWALEIFGWSESLRLLGPLKVSSMRGAVRGQSQDRLKDQLRCKNLRLRFGSTTRRAEAFSG